MRTYAECVVCIIHKVMLLFNSNFQNFSVIVVILKHKIDFRTKAIMEIARLPKGNYCSNSMNILTIVGHEPALNLTIAFDKIVNFQ